MLDYSGQWLIANPGRGNRVAGGPVRAPNFRTNVWRPATAPNLAGDPESTTYAIPAPRGFINAGTPLPVIQLHLGRESIQTTVDVYGHLDRRSAQAAADAMGELLAAPS